jgi:signal transduction histidine kinase
MSPLPPHHTLARLASVLSERLTFAKIGADLITAEVSHNWAHLLPHEPLRVGMPITHLTVLSHSEDILADLLAGRLPEFVVQDVNEETAEGTYYLTYTLYPFNPNEPSEGLLLLVEEVTNLSALKQKIVQERNELRLVQSQLSRANQDLLRLNELKSLFLSFAAHDLRTPLTSIRGYADLVLRQQSPENRSVQYLRVILAQSYLLERLCQDILDLEAIRQGRLRLEPRPTDLGHLLHQAVAALLPLAEAKGIMLHLSLPVQPVVAQVDGNRIEQILHNLISNSTRFTHSKGEIRVGLNQETADTCALTVSDTGQGIPPERLPHLFKLAYELPHSEKERRGTGLGLYLVHTLTEQHGGTVRVASELGRGTTFTLRLPMANGHS